ncbi:MAG: hypothetical protein Q7R92_00825 [bacterium]|nr:hypothetical protein [bacterium]
MTKKIKKILIVFSLLAAVFAVAHFALAATADVGLNYAEGTGLSAASDPRVIAANIIRIALGFLGIIAVGLIIYAGYLWMTANGEAEKVEKAKKILIGAVIGLLICLASFAIASYILSRLTEATGGENTDPFACSGPDCPGGGPDFSFGVSGTIPGDQAKNVIRNVRVRVFLNDAMADNIDQNVLNNNFKVEKIAFINSADETETNLPEIQPVEGVVESGGGRREINFKSNANCGDENNTQNCLDSWSKYKVTVNGGSGIKSINNQSLSCAGNSCKFVFSTNNLIDTSGPTAGIISQQICRDDGSLKLGANTVTGWARDDAGFSSLGFLEQKVGESRIKTDIVKPGKKQTYQSESYQYDTKAMAVGDQYNFSFSAYDLAYHKADSSFTTTIRPGHCCNGIKDPTETAIDCGGECGACDGAACANDISVPATCSDNLCASQTCRSEGSTAAKCSAAGYAAGTTNCCLCQSPPVITGISPAGGFCKNEPNEACLADSDCASGDSCDQSAPNGKAGNFFTIYGRNFGASPGNGGVYASSTLGWVKAKLANDSAAGNVQCTNVWTDNKITAIVPSGAQTGAIKIVKSDSASTTSVFDFKINDIDRPGICSLDPDSGKQDEVINYYGIKLSGASPYFGNINNRIAGVGASFNDNKKGTAKVPNITAGNTSSFALKDKVYSNYLDFTKDKELYKGPFISSFDPKEGPAGQYVTINGGGFGATAGEVYFGDAITGKPASFDFPKICADSIWSDKQVIVKVPENLQNRRNYKITMKIGAWPAIDTTSIQPEIDRNFIFNSASPLKPSLCKIDPAMGKINTRVSLYGEYFGEKKNPAVLIGDKPYPLIRFQADKDQTVFDYWDKDNDPKITGIRPDKIITKVPNQAVTGPVKVVQTVTVSTRAGQGVSQVIGNGKNFKVGICETKDDCGSVSLCCSAGTPYAGQCKTGTVEQDVCFPEIKSCVYEWNFSTGGSSSACASDKDTDNNPATLSECGDPESCSGYGSSLASCYGQMCPNSPGQCSGNSGSVATGVKCGNDVCKKAAGCLDKDGVTLLCTYSATLNRCVKNSVACNLTDSITDANGVKFALKCGTVDNKNVWYYDSNKTCASSGYTKSADKNKCLGSACETCSSGFVCQKDGGAGVCAVNNNICPAGSTCDPAKNECLKTTPQSSCECCCSISQNTASGNPGCCTGLKCGDTCGSDTSLTDGPDTNDDGIGDSNAGQGKCTGCTVKNANGQVNQAASNASCNCSGTSGKFCDTSGAGGLGTCNDCTQLSTAGLCSGLGAGSCCLDATKSDVCRGVSAGGSTVKDTDFQEVYRQDFNTPGDLAGWTPSAECAGQYAVKDGFLEFQGNNDCNLGVEFNKFNFRVGSEYKIKIKIKRDDTNGAIALGLGTASGNYTINPSSANNEKNYEFVFGPGLIPTISARYNHIKLSIDKVNDSYKVDGFYQVDYIAIEEKSPYSFCAYYSCGSGADAANCQGAQKTGTYRTKDCGNQCQLFPQFGLECNNKTAKADTCDANVCTNFSCLDENGYGVGKPNPSYEPTAKNNTCGTCCCDPKAGSDQCKAVNSKLSCVADKGSCSGANRGLCCGCSADSDCGSSATTGCGTDTCCSSRPTVTATVPVAGAGNSDDKTKVCRNALIQADFNRPMSLNTFSGNVIVAGEYGADQCPDNTTYLTAAYKPTFFAKVKFWLAKLPLIDKLFASAARADAVDGNFCAIKGTVNGVNNKDTSTLEFAPSQILEPKRKYYVIIKGDTNTSDAVKEGVLSVGGISMKPVLVDEKTFNGITYKGKIWSFTTMSDQGPNKGVCEISKVIIDPDSHLFQTNKNDPNDDDPKKDTFDKIADSDRVFTATALNVQGQALAPVKEYGWNWIWSTDNNKVAVARPVANGPGYFGRELIRANDNITEGETYVNAKAEITISSIVSSPIGKTIPGKAKVYVLVCSNPWPTVEPNGEWRPFRDYGLKCSDPNGDCSGPYSTEGSSCGESDKCQYNNCTTQSAYCDNTNFELYYCRDAGGPGTADDLPAILSDSAVIRGRSANLKCDDGTGSCEGKAQDDDCSDDSGKCEVDILKEFYFFREGKPSAAGDFKVSVLPRGGAVSASWDSVTGATGYKVYYGTASGKYTDSVEAAAQIETTQTKEITGLTNGKKYYFAMTSYNAQKAESGYSDPISVTPADSQGPAVAPTLFKATPGNMKVDLEWANNYSETVSFRAFYKATDDCNDQVNFGSSIPVATSLAATSTAAINNLANGINYCFGAVAYDSSGNKSATTTASARPFAPAANLALAGVGDGLVKLSWSSALGAAKYKIYYNRSGDSVIASAATSTPGTTANPQIIFGLTNGTAYNFMIRSAGVDSGGGDIESANSNKISATPSK